MDVDVAAGVEIPRTFGSARRADWFFGDVVPFLILDVKVLSWKVSGDLFLSQTSMLETGLLKPGMTDFFHVGESIPRPGTLVDTNDSLRARGLHTMVAELDLTLTNTWMNADSEQELFTTSETQCCQPLHRNNAVGK